ncbi:MAG: type II toxin-antitoxin system Phd/YefM family antitoxin [Bacteriovorax sp.]|nr:type II toxin-antitoxin system Phd/YefM family antitoxin [Bacteriovorax sp.]
MESTSPKKLRAELKDYMDMATSEPIRIQRRSGENYVLMNEEKFAEMQNEITSLQRRLLAMSDIVDGKATEYLGKDTRLKRLKK